MWKVQHSIEKLEIARNENNIFHIQYGSSELSRLLPFGDIHLYAMSISKILNLDVQSFMKAVQTTIFRFKDSLMKDMSKPAIIAFVILCGIYIVSSIKRSLNDSQANKIAEIASLLNIKNKPYREFEISNKGKLTKNAGSTMEGINQFLNDTSGEQGHIVLFDKYKSKIYVVATSPESYIHDYIRRYPNEELKYNKKDILDDVRRTLNLPDHQEYKKRIVDSLRDALDDIVEENKDNFKLKLDIHKDNDDHFTLKSYDKSESLYDKVEKSILGLPFFGSVFTTILSVFGITFGDSLDTEVTTLIEEFLMLKVEKGLSAEIEPEEPESIISSLFQYFFSESKDDPSRQ